MYSTLKFDGILPPDYPGIRRKVIIIYTCYTNDNLLLVNLYNLLHSHVTGIKGLQIKEGDVIYVVRMSACPSGYWMVSFFSLKSV